MGDPSKAQQEKDKSTEEQSSREACSAVCAGGGPGRLVRGLRKGGDTAGGDAVMLALEPEWMGGDGRSTGPPRA